MLKAIEAVPDRAGLSAAEWARYLHCSASTVIKTPAWKEMQLKREDAKEERKNRQQGE
jgi:hypothetical protein